MSEPQLTLWGLTSLLWDAVSALSEQEILLHV